MQKHKRAKKSFLVQPDGTTWILYKLRGCRHKAKIVSNNIPYLSRLRKINTEAEVRIY